MADEKSVRNAPDLLSRAIAQFLQLIRGEFKLAQAELSEILSRASAGLIMLSLAIILLLVALNTLATALVGLVAAAGLSLGMAGIAVSAGLIVIAIALGFLGKSRISPNALKPNRTLDNLKDDLDVMKGEWHD